MVEWIRFLGGGERSEGGFGEGGERKMRERE